jgi:hypothetical protein
VTGLRDPFVMAELEDRSTRRRNNNRGIVDSMLYRNRINEGFDGTGPGIRIRYSQLRNCLDSPFIGN